MALYTGMRSGELFALEWTSVDFDNKMIYVHRNWTSKEGFGPTKGRYWRAVPMSEQMIPFLKELKLKTGNTKFVLPRFNSWQDGRQAEILREFCIGSGIPSVRFHTLRACFATQLIKDGIAPAVVMKICGWRGPYRRHTLRFLRVKRIINQFNSRTWNDSHRKILNE